MSQGTNERAQPTPVVVVPAAEPQTAVVPMDDPDEIVTYFLPDGQEVSNDPRFYQQQQEAGFLKRMESGDIPDSVREQVRQEVLAEIEAERLAQTHNTGVAANEHTQGSTTTGYLPTDSEGSDEEPDDDLTDMDVNELKATAEAEEVDTSGVRKKSELKARIREHRAG